MNRAICGIFLGFSGLVTGCTGVSEPTFATRNAEANLELDLQSVVRTQSNELLALTQALQAHGVRNFNATKKLNRDLDETAAHMDQLHLNLPALLASQDVELAELRETANKAAVKERVQAIQAYRKALLASLNASAARANETAEKMIAAETTGRQDLKDPSVNAQYLARDLEAARTMIEMQL
ncbi:hypothetical protein [Planktotalea sp.]|uniref:hypothetical protein n=1 Tax=Planktotalea sp. TaxID=2029877 RepID=UPI003299ACE9